MKKSKKFLENFLISFSRFLRFSVLLTERNERMLRMKSETDFAGLYQALIDRHMHPDLQQLAAMRDQILRQLSILDSPKEETSS